jgi:hypothetical protein
MAWWRPQPALTRAGRCHTRPRSLAV